MVVCRHPCRSPPRWPTGRRPRRRAVDRARVARPRRELGAVVGPAAPRRPGGDRRRARRLRRRGRPGGDDGELPGVGRGFGAAGMDAAEAGRLIASSVALAAGGPGRGLGRGSVGPYGAMLADGSEYTGAYVDGGGRRPPPRVPPAADGAARRGRGRRPGLRDRPGGRGGRGADRRGRRARRADLAVAHDGAGRRRRRPHPARGERAADVFAMAADVDAVIAVGVNCTDPAGVGHRAIAAAAARQAGGGLPEQRRGLGRRRPAVDRDRGHRAGRRPGLGRRRCPAGRRLLPVRPQHIAAITESLELDRGTHGHECPGTGQRIGLPPVTATRARTCSDASSLASST